MKTVTLRNGAEELQPLVNVTMHTLRALMETNPIWLYELAMKCRDASHSFFGSTGENLARAGLVRPDGSVHSSIRNIVLSSTEGDGLDLRLINPLVQQQASDVSDDDSSDEV